MATLVFDSSPLSCFARSGRLVLLERLTTGYERVTTRAVINELEQGCADFPPLQDALTLPWIKPVPVDGLDELRLFAEYSRRLVAGERNVGEASVLAWAEANAGIALIDDQAAVQVGRERGVEVKRTLAIIARGVRVRLLSRGDAAVLVDDLVRVGARFPCTGGEFVAWATAVGLLGGDEPG
jgi:predicted nucleic acid-binding protein